MAAAGLRLRDLGTLRIDFDVDGPKHGAPRSPEAGSAGDSLGGKPARILSVLLVNANRRVSRDVLVYATWGEQPNGAGATLESHVWRLRKALEPGRRGRGQPSTYVINDSGGYRLAVNPDNADSLRFAQLAEHGDALLAGGDAQRALLRYESALRLWRGRPFEPVADQEWAAAAIARLTELHMQVREQHVDAMLRCGHPERAIVLLEELTTAMPLREKVWSQLMLARHRVGRTEEALAAYRRAREVLLEELGLEPGPLLTELHQRILDLDPSLSLAASSVPGVSGAGRTTDKLDTVPDLVFVQLPGRLAPLIGREVELDRLTRLVSRARLVTVVGPAGCGKTRLAIEAVRAAAQAAPDGVWFVDLTAIDDPAAAADTIASVIGLAAPVVGDTLTALRAYLRDRQALLLLDNCEHLLPDVGDLVDHLLSHDSHGRVLATSREPLDVNGEVLWTLGPLPTHDERDPAATQDDLAPPRTRAEQTSPAAELFIARVRDLEPGWEFPSSEHEATEVESICAAVDGLPLAIELAAGRIRSASLAEIRAQATGGLADLGRVGRGRVDHHQTIERSIQWSVRLLSDAERIAHARLSVLPGVFTVEAATAVLGHDPIDQAIVPDLLAQLVHRSLLGVVRPTTPDQPTRYRQLSTVRAHAARALANVNADNTDHNDADDPAAAVAHRTGFIVDLLTTVPALDAADTDGWYARIEHNHDTLIAVLHHTLVERPDPVGVHITAATTNYWPFRNRILQYERWAELALRQPDADLGDRTLTQLGHAAMLAVRDRADLTAELVRSAIEHLDSVDPHRIMPLLAGNAFQVWFQQGPPLDFVEHEIARRAESGDLGLVLYRDLLTATRILTSDGPAATTALAAQLLTRAEELYNPFAGWLAAVLGGICALLTNDPATGVEMGRQARRHHHALGATFEASYLEFDGNFAVLRGELDLAVRLFSAARAHAFRAGTPWPLSPATQPMLNQVRQLMPADQFETAWRTRHAPADNQV